MFSSTLKLTEIFAFTSKQCQVMDISDEDDAGPWAEGEKKAKWEDHRFGLSNLDVFASKALNSSFASFFEDRSLSCISFHLGLSIFVILVLGSLDCKVSKIVFIGKAWAVCFSVMGEIIAHLDTKNLGMFQQRGS